MTLIQERPFIANPVGASGYPERLRPPVAACSSLQLVRAWISLCPKHSASRLTSKSTVTVRTHEISLRSLKTTLAPVPSQIAPKLEQRYVAINGGKRGDPVRHVPRRRGLRGSGPGYSGNRKPRMSSIRSSRYSYCVLDEIYPNWSELQRIVLASHANVDRTFFRS